MTVSLSNDIFDDFFHQFTVEPVVSRAQMREVGRLRHHVYCEEFAYEPPRPSGIEADQHDGHSLHCLVRHNRSGTPAGCVRLICASEEHTLALEDYCLPAMHLDHMSALSERRHALCEFSRLAVAPGFRIRRRLGDSAVQTGVPAECLDDERACYPLVTTATFLAAFATADTVGRSNVFGMMEASLPRLLRRAGIAVQPAGDFMDYHGRRAPHFVTVEEAVSGMRPEVRQLYERIHDAVSANPVVSGTAAVA
ncbi:PEP-CTERM/exosortase system-associated acyltransferase [Chromatocurvus halotolerans]|uniref:N-acyl amino acid synthase of PEP-CTERM/exosortase system n=1 Tax=Chromatocurvus halotolerans TaxID=1132028 RepID=A0A4R2KP09_9GAMM|nr:PEP-CTERM/exosortase system-associated acyltransferase [Chromatocurvus halotolerans]TCO74337.1 N-acyl amino acid synthase of PEP-CTERM/exosortase system [Chromatocurvus halotolerans]